MWPVTFSFTYFKTFCVTNLQNSVPLSKGVDGSLTTERVDRLRVGVRAPSGQEMLRFIICLRESGKGLPTLLPKQGKAHNKD